MLVINIYKLRKPNFNFKLMKKVLLSLLAIAAVVLSCQNYDDEFDALNSKVSSLESQIASLSGLQATLATVQSSVSALQTAVNAIPDPSSSITNLTSKVTDILADIAELQTALASALTQADLDALKASLESTIADLESLVDANADELATLGIDVTNILGTAASFEGNLTINSAQTLTYAVSLGSKVKSIKGNVHVQLTAANKLTAAEVNAVTKNIMNVLGNVTIESYKEQVDVSSLASVSGDYVVIGFDAMDDALVTVGDMLLDYAAHYVFPNLTTAKKIVLVDNAAVTANTTTGVPAQLGVTKIDFLALTSMTEMGTNNPVGTHTSGASLHSSGGSSHSSGGNITVTSSYTAGSLDFQHATDVIIGDVEVHSVTAPKATDVQLHFGGELTGNLSVTAVLATSVTIKAISNVGADAITIDQAATGTTTLTGATFKGAITTDAKVLSASAATNLAGGVTANTATSLDLSKAVTVGPLSANSTTSLALPAATTAGAISATAATSFVAKSLVASADITIKAGTAAAPTTMELKSIPTANIKSLASLGTLIVHEQAVSLNLTGGLLLSAAHITGKASTVDVTVSATEVKLADLQLKGKLGVVTVGTSGTDGLTVLKGFSTAGTIKSLVVQNAKALESITMGHTEDAAVGSSLTVTNNDKLTSLTTSFNHPTGLSVTGNETLATLDFASFTEAPLNYTANSSISFTVTGNYKITTAGAANIAASTGMKGDYVAAAAATATAAAVTEKFTQAGLKTLAPFILLDTGTATSKFTATISLDYLDTAKNTAVTAMNSIADVKTL